MDPSLDYLDNDVSYLLGLTVGRGTITRTGSIQRLVIEFPFVNLKVEGITKSFDQKDKLVIGLNPIRSRVDELADINVRQDVTDNSVVLTFESMKNSIFWRNIQLLTGGKTSFREFQVPQQILDADETVQKEFLRGYADACGSVRASNYEQRASSLPKRYRVYLDVQNPNWILPRQLCYLLQDRLGVPVQTITYGHPNIRDPGLKEYKEGKKNAWMREHQIKVFCEYFEKIGFYMEHKQEILKELAAANRTGFPEGPPGFCNPPKNLRPKARHPMERSVHLPRELRGKHYDSYWQICADLGCYRYKQWRTKNPELT